MHVEVTNLSVAQIESGQILLASQLQEQIMNLFLNIVTAVSIGMLVGTEFAVSAFINPILRKLDDQLQAQAIRLFAKRLGFVMPFWYVACFLLLIAGAIVRHYGTGEVLLISASVLWAGVIVHTILVLVPINNRMIAMDVRAFSPEAKREHGKWDSLHRLRVAALATSMVCFLAAICK